jgi:ABC-type lipoprotein release transport system permease subunit
LLAAFGLSKVLYGVEALDPVGMPVVMLSLAIVAMVASVIPARAASRVDPVVAMRTE